MGFEVVDGYLLGNPVSKTDAIDALLAQPLDNDAAAPFYRAIAAVGVRAADEAFVALRLVLAGKVAGDAAVRRVRALSAVARACARDDGGGLRAILGRDGAVLKDLPLPSSGKESDLVALGAAAKAAYYDELQH